VSRRIWLPAPPPPSGCRVRQRFFSNRHFPSFASFFERKKHFLCYSHLFFSEGPSLELPYCCVLPQPGLNLLHPPLPVSVVGSFPPFLIMESFFFPVGFPIPSLSRYISFPNSQTLQSPILPGMLSPRIFPPICGDSCYCRNFFFLHRVRPFFLLFINLRVSPQARHPFPLLQ